MFFFDFRYTFSFPEKTSKFRLRPKRPKISKIWSRIVFGFDFGRFLDPFWNQFFFNILGFPENLYFATVPQRNPHFHLPNPLILEQIFDQILMFFRVSFSDTLFSSFFQHDTQKHDLWTPLESSWVQNGAQNRPSGAKRPPKSIRRCLQITFCKKPVFL